MPTPFPFAALLFDLDGVLADTTRLHFRVWEAFGRTHGHEPSTAELLATTGRRGIEVLRDWFGDRLSEGQVLAWTLEREALFKRFVATHPVTQIAGARAYVAAVVEAGIPRAVVTSAVPGNATISLAQVGLEGAFPLVITAADVIHGKPSPEPYLKAAALLGVPPNRALVFEDAVAGLRAARAAGARCVALTTSFPADLLACEQPDWLVQDFTDLPAELWP
ncbi:MAG: HAD family phosphatase [Pseudomonadota bacterium]|nr:HAD family phosphatase [Pseudomonadota bacterium]